MNFSEANQYLEQVQARGIQLGLDRVRALLRELGNPEITFKSILVSGTNGKGSTGMYLSSILQEAGYKVGTYTSPPLYSNTERILINKEKIPGQEFADLIEQVKPSAEKHNATFFETLTAAAYLHFKGKIDYAVLEVGMGGRYDATNIVSPEISVITNIELDHTQYLGNTIGQIAAEKAEIVHENSVLVSAEQKPKAASVLKQKCKQTNSHYHQVQDEYPTKTTNFSLREQIFDAGNHKGLHTSLLDFSQPLNAAAAISAVEKINGITEQQIRDGIAKTLWPGRFEIVEDSPLVTLSAAHNPAGFRELEKSLARIPHKRTLTVLGMCGDKDTVTMQKIAEGFSDEVYKTSFGHPRSWQGNRDPKFVLTEAVGEANPDDLVCVCGSIFLISQVRKQWLPEVTFI